VADIDLPGGFRAPAEPDALRLERIIDRALLALVVSYSPGYLTRGGIPKTKTAKQRQIERGELDQLLRLMVNDLGIRTGNGYTEEALRWGLCELAVERGLMTRHPDEPFCLAYGRGGWSLWDVMTDERKDREHPGRRAKPQARTPAADEPARNIPARTARPGCPCGGWGTHICPIPSDADRHLAEVHGPILTVADLDAAEADHAAACGPALGPAEPD
jgi:hypothetical protein